MGFILWTAVCKKSCNWKVNLKNIKKEDLSSTQYILITTFTALGADLYQGN